MVRLKYYTVDNLLYTDWFTLGPNFIIRGIVNTDTYHIQITEFDSELVYEYQGKNIRDSKTHLKNHLTKIGLNFEGEIRKRL